MLLLLTALPVLAGAITLGWDVQPTGDYALTVDTAPWYASPSFAAAPPTICVQGKALALAIQGPPAPAAGTDSFGDWTGVSVALSAPSTPPTLVTHTFKTYAALPSLLVATAAFPSGVDAAGGGAACGGTAAVRTSFPQWNTSAALAPSLGVFSWRGTALGDLPAALGLGHLGQNTLDSGPVVSFFKGRPGVPHPGLVWSTLTSHKIVTQATSQAGGDVPAPLTALWSASRAEQVLCLSEQCASEQRADGAYAAQRIEGYGFSSVAAGAQACANGVTVPVAPLALAWSAARLDNFVGAQGASTPERSSYAPICDNGYIVAASTGGSVAGTLPLYAYNRTYNASHWDWAAVASPEGVAWASAAGYTRGALLGYVFAAAPTACAAAGGGVYTQGVSAAIPSIPAGWDYSVVYSLADGGPTAAVYAWGQALQGYYATARLPSVTLTSVGYFTDDGAYYYVWEAFGIEARPWPAEVGLVLVKEDLYARGIPVAYMQVRAPPPNISCALPRTLPPSRTPAHAPSPPSKPQLDDWWYNGKFYFGFVPLQVAPAAPFRPFLPHELIPRPSHALLPFLPLLPPFPQKCKEHHGLARLQCLPPFPQWAGQVFRPAGSSAAALHALLGR